MVHRLMRVRVLVSLLLALFALAGCGSDPSSSTKVEQKTDEQDQAGSVTTIVECSSPVVNVNVDCGDRTVTGKPEKPGGE